MRNRGFILFLVATLLLSCSPRALREAEEAVTQADSMRAAGQMYADSVRLAQSYATLRAWRNVRADEYAHACYHYGRLLREKDNPVEAMHCFIEASHTPTHDYHILGRAYSSILTLLDFPLKKIAETIHYSYPSAIKTLKKRIADKLSTTPPKMKDFLLHLPQNS